MKNILFIRGEEFLKTRNDRINLYKTHSDIGKTLLSQEQTGVYYKIAVDIENANYTYIEVDEDLNQNEIIK